MLIYQKARSANSSIFVQPGMDYPDNSEWKEPTGAFKMFEVKFKHGVSDVADNLGKYLIEKGNAFKNKQLVRI